MTFSYGFHRFQPFHKCVLTFHHDCNDFQKQLLWTAKQLHGCKNSKIQSECFRLTTKTTDRSKNNQKSPMSILEISDYLSLSYPIPQNQNYKESSWKSLISKIASGHWRFLTTFSLIVNSPNQRRMKVMRILQYA